MKCEKLLKVLRTYFGVPGNVDFREGFELFGEILKQLKGKETIFDYECL